MSTNPEITLDLIDSDTMVRIAPLVDASDRVFKPIFNGAGTFSLTIPIGSEAAYKVRLRKTAILFTRNGIPRWSGAVTSAVWSAKSGRVSIVATGWKEELENRFVWKSQEASLTFPLPGQVGGFILKALLDAVNAQTDSNGTIRPVRLRFNAATDSQVRTGSYKQGDQINAKFDELVNIENGFSILIDPMTKGVTTKTPSSFSIRKDVKFGYGVDPNNLYDVEANLDGTAIRNRINVVASNGIVYSVDDPSAINESGVMLEEWIPIDVADPATALALATAELVYKRYGKVVYRLTPKQYGDLPRPYDTFDWGDAGYLSIDRDSLKVNSQVVRIFSGTLTYTDRGDEIISELQVEKS